MNPLYDLSNVHLILNKTVGNIEELMLSAKEAMIKKNFQESIDLFTEIINLDPDNFDAIFSRGTVNFIEKNYQNALEDFTQGLSLKSDSSKLLCSRANTYLALDNNGSALHDLNQAIEIDPQYISAYLTRSEVMERMGEKEQAKADKEVGLRLQQQMSQSLLESQGFMFQTW